MLPPKYTTQFVDFLHLLPLQCNMLFSPSLPPSYFTLEIFLFRCDEHFPLLPECYKLMVAFTVSGQKDAVGKSRIILLSVLLKMPEDQKYI